MFLVNLTLKNNNKQQTVNVRKCHLTPDILDSEREQVPTYVDTFKKVLQRKAKTSTVFALSTIYLLPLEKIIAT